jgi:peptide/nickel transport system ATP-binding protein
MSEALLSVRGLRTTIDVARGSLRAVDGIDLELRRGECFALVGESGCGKSMSALSLTRLLPETARIAGGSVLLDDVELLDLPEAAMRGVRGARVAIIFQEPATSLNPVLTVGRQIGEAIERHTSLRGAALERRVLELLQAVGIADGERRRDEYPFQLSGGLKQRVMIAIALAAEPELLIADEPTTALDVTIQAQILDLLARLQAERRMTILLITHDLGIVARMADRVAVMYAGQIVELATREALFRTPRHPYTAKLFDALPTAALRGRELAVIPGQVPQLVGELRGCRFAERCDRVQERCRSEAPLLADAARDHEAVDGAHAVLDGAHAVRCHFPLERRAATPAAARGAGRAAQGEARTIVQVRGLQVHFPVTRGPLRRKVGSLRAVDGVSFDLRAGCTLALVGESGCGKTTLGKAILQLVRPTAGSVRLRPPGGDPAGVELTALTRAQLRPWRTAMQIVFQDPYASLNPRIRVLDILLEGMRSLGIGRDEAERLARVDRLLEQVGLPADARYAYAHEFSGGQRQRIAIARALAVEPALLVCDEPTSALDVSVQAQILNLLDALQRRLGLAYLFITHNLAVVEHLADEVAVMYLGRIVERGTAEEVLGAPRHPYTQALLAAVPTLDGGRREIAVGGELPSAVNPPSGCHFHPRCPQRRPECSRAYPEETALSATRSVRCFLYEDVMRGKQ